MKTRTPILFLAVIFAVICLYQLSFTWVVQGAEEDAYKYAEGQIDIDLNNELLRIHLRF